MALPQPVRVRKRKWAPPRGAMPRRDHDVGASIISMPTVRQSPPHCSQHRLHCAPLQRERIDAVRRAVAALRCRRHRRPAGGRGGCSSGRAHASSIAPRRANRTLPRRRPRSPGRAATYAGHGAREQDGAAAARHHMACCLSAGEEAAVAGELPGLAEKAFARVEERRGDVRAGVVEMSRRATQTCIPPAAKRRATAAPMTSPAPTSRATGPLLSCALLSGHAELDGTLWSVRKRH